MTKICLLTDYHNTFSSKYGSKPYRSGYDKQKLIDYFKDFGYTLGIIKISDIQFLNIDWKDKLILYTSSEEPGLYYKQYIEDIIYSLKLKGAILIPPFELLRANNDKVFMELLRDIVFNDIVFKSFTFSSLEDVYNNLDKLPFPLVFKTADQALSSGVSLIKNKKELIHHIKKTCKTYSFKQIIKENIRQKKHSGYKKESFYQRKFILQPFIANLKFDWKVLIYGNRIFILKRHTRKNDFRASGSHINYKAGSEADFPLKYLDNLVEFKEKLNVPNISIDFVTDGKRGYIIEFQAINFGTSTILYCKDYCIKENGQWIFKKIDTDLEEIYTNSIVHFLKKKGY